MKLQLGANFNAQIKEDLFWNFQVIIFYKEPLLFNTGRLASGIRKQQSYF
jgi:hypothetical protein